MKKILSLTIIALIALIALTTSVSAADVTVNTEADLKDALLTDGTVKLSGDIEITKSIRTTTNVTVDLNGFKIIGPDDGKANWYAFIVEGGTFTLKDTSTAQTGEIYAKCYGIETKAGTFIMESGKITATKNTKLGAAVVNYGGKVEIKGGTLIAAVWALDAESYFSDAEVAISGGTFEAGTAQEYAVAIQIGGGNSKGKETVSISGGTFKGTNAFAVDANSDTSVSITGGTFGVDVSDYLPENAKVEEDENGNYVVIEAYDIVVNATKGGKVILNKEKAYAGDIIEIKTEVEDGYKLKRLVAITIADSEIKIVDNKFTMPDMGAIVIAEFEKVEEPTAGGQGTAEQEPAKKDETPKTGAFDIALYVLGIVALVSVVGTVKAKTGKYSK